MAHDFRNLTCVDKLSPTWIVVPTGKFVHMVGGVKRGELLIKVGYGEDR